MRIFLSYPSEQKSIAEPIAFSLRSRGHKVFLDKDDLPPGRSYDAQIQMAIEQSDVLVYLISPQSVEKGRYTMTEMEFARAAWTHPDNRVLPVLVAPTDMSKIPSFLKGVTILEPSGNITAETVAAVDRLRGTDFAVRQGWQAAGLAAALCAATIGLMYLIVVARTPATSEYTLYLVRFIGFAGFGLPFALMLWIWGRGRSWRTFLPIFTCAFAVWFSAEIVPYFEIAGTINQSAIDWAQVTPDNAAARDASDSTSGEASIDEDPPEKKEVLGQIDTANETAARINNIADMAGFGIVLMIGVLAGASGGSPPLQNLGRWLTGIAAAGLAGAFIFVFLSTLFEREIAYFAAIVALVPFTAGLIGYWMARGPAA